MLQWWYNGTLPDAQLQAGAGFAEMGGSYAAVASDLDQQETAAEQAFLKEAAALCTEVGVWLLVLACRAHAPGR